MTHSQFLITIVLLQQGLVALMWLGAARVGLAPRPALHWGGGAALMAACLMLVAMRGTLTPWITVWLANLAGVAAAVAQWRGVELFCKREPSDRQHALYVGAFAVLLVPPVAGEWPTHWLVLLTSLALAWPMLRASADIGTRLRFEFGNLPAWAFAAPLGLIGAAFTLRALFAPVLAESIAGPSMQPGAFNAAFGLFLLVALLSAHCGLAAMAVLRMVRQLQHVSDHDALTGVLNRRGFEDVLGRECERLRRYRAPFALLSIDIDHFKQINDRFGHAVGDEVLAAVAQELARGLRDVDRIGRTGGEEFCVLLPHTDEQGADQAAMRLLECVRARRFGPAGEAARVTVSIGVAVSRDSNETRNDLFRRLDRALYRAKECGRDRIEAAEPAPSAVRLVAA